MRYYKVENTWVLSMRWRFGLIHLGHHKWWKPVVYFPGAVVGQLMIAAGWH